MRRFILIIMALQAFSLAVSAPAWGQRLIVVTSALNTAREAGGLYLQSVALRSRSVLPGPVKLSGTRLNTAPRRFDHDSGYYVMTSAPGGLNTLTRIAGEPFNAYRQPAPFAAQNVETDLLRVMLHVPDAASMPVLVERNLESGSSDLVMGRFEAGEAWRGGFQEEQRWPLEGALLDATFQGASNRVLFLTSAPDGGYALLGGDVYRDTGPSALVEIPRGLTAIRGGQGQLASPGTGTYVYILISGFDGAADTPEAVTDLYCVDTRTWELQGGGLRVRGHPAAAREAMQFDQDGQCWVATRQLGSDFGLATLIGLVSQEGIGRELYKLREYVVPGILQQFIIAPDDSTSTVAVAAGNRVEIWPEGIRENLDTRFNGEISLLQWVNGQPLVAEENRIHLLSPATARVERDISLQSGWVRSVTVVPPAMLSLDDGDGDGLSADAERRMGSKPGNPDTDGDGIHDGIDPEPLMPSPRLEAPVDIKFRPEAVGHELRAVAIEAVGATASRWVIDYDREVMPWLIVHPRVGSGSGYAYFAIDPSYYDGTTALFGTVRIILKNHAGDRVREMPCFESPGQTTVWIPAASRLPASVLWLWPDGGNSTVRTLQTQLARPPLLFSHSDYRGPYSRDPGRYSIVVISAEAAASGAVLPQDLAAYISDGGGVLFVGGPVDPAFAPLVEGYFQGLGIRIDANAGLSGRFPGPDGTVDLLRNWPDTPLRDGAAIYSGAGLGVPAKEEGKWAFLALEFGYGRLALVSSPALFGGVPGRWAKDLFYWLSSAGKLTPDVDGDGLPNGVEDPNNNGSVDFGMTEGQQAGVLGLSGRAEPGETHWLDPDTDKDGLPDGMEDRNQNGRVDEGETDPRNLDSDGDGVFDGADSTAFAAYGSPRIDRVYPAECPLEGGDVLTISGRNLSAVETVLIDDIPARFVGRHGAGSLAVESPGRLDNEAGPAVIDLLDVQGTRMARFPGLLAYTPRSTVQLRAERAGWLVQSRDYLEGMADVYLDVPDGVKLGPVFIVLRPSEGGLQWRGIEAGPGIRDNGIAFDPEERADGSMRVRLSGSLLTQASAAALFRVRWHLDRSVATADELEFNFNGSSVLAQNRQPLSLSPVVYTVALGTPSSTKE